jgi:hypothetical protein
MFLFLFQVRHKTTWDYLQGPRWTKLLITSELPVFDKCWNPVSPVDYRIQDADETTSVFKASLEQYLVLLPYSKFGMPLLRPVFETKLPELAKPDLFYLLQKRDRLCFA